MEAGAPKQRLFLLATLLSCIWIVPAAGQEPPDVAEVPAQFNLDLKAAARLRPQLVEQSVPAAGRYAPGGRVFGRLVEQIGVPTQTGFAQTQFAQSRFAQSKFAWELRIVDDGNLNAYSSPDGTVYV